MPVPEYHLGGDVGGWCGVGPAACQPAVLDIDITATEHLPARRPPGGGGGVVDASIHTLQVSFSFL